VALRATSSHTAARGGDPSAASEKGRNDFETGGFFIRGALRRRRISRNAPGLPDGASDRAIRVA